MEAFRTALMKSWLNALSKALLVVPLLALVVTLIYAYIVKPLQARNCKFLVVRNTSEQERALAKYHQLLHEEQWEEALVEHSKCSLRLPLTDEWKIRVGLAFCDIKDKQKVKDVFSLTTLILADPHSAFTNHYESCLKTLYDLIQARTRHFVPSKPTTKSPDDDYVPDFGLMDVDFLIHLFALYAEYIGLCNQTQHYPDGPRQEFPRIAATIIQKEKHKECVKDWIFLMLQSDSRRKFFGKAMVDQWKVILGDGDATKAEEVALERCNYWVQEENWEKALSHYNIYSRLSLSSTATRDPGIVYKMCVGLALENIEDGELVDQVLKLARAVVLKNPSREEREQCIEKLYDVFHARIQSLVAFKNKDKIFNRGHLDEIPFLSKSLLEVCENSNLGGAYFEYNRSRLVAFLTPVVEEVKGSKYANTCVNRFVKAMDPYTEDLYL